MAIKKVIEYRRGSLTTVNIPPEDAMQMLRDRAANDPEHNMEDYLLTMMAGGCGRVNDGAETILIGTDIEIPVFSSHPYII